MVGEGWRVVGVKFIDGITLKVGILNRAYLSGASGTGYGPNGPVPIDYREPDLSLSVCLTSLAVVISIFLIFI